MTDEKSNYLVFLEKLFDTLTLSINKVDNTCKEVKNNQIEVMRFIEKIHLDELNSSMKDHDKCSENNIRECTLKVVELSDNFSKQLSEISTKIRTMIIIVLTAFTLFSIAYFVAKSVSDIPSKQQIEILFKKYEDKQNQKYDERINQLKEYYQSEMKK